MDTDILQTIESGFIVYGLVSVAVFILFLWYKIQDAKQNKNEDPPQDGSGTK